MTIHDARTLDGFALMPGCFEGISVRALEAGTALVIQTQHTRYRLLVLEPPNLVLITGGKLCPEPVEARIVGATITGGMLKAGWIGIGLRLEIRIAGERVTTSPVESVTVEESPYAFTDSPRASAA